MSSRDSRGGRGGRNSTFFLGKTTTSRPLSKFALAWSVYSVGGKLGLGLGIGFGVGVRERGWRV